MSLDTLPRVPLARLPTPLEEAPRLAAALGVARLFIKRDDLTDLAMGGNKVRSLEVLLGEALAQQADTIITTAGAQSNFLRLTAAAARRVGLRPVLVVRGRPDAPSAGNLLLMRVFDAEIHYVETHDPYDETTIVKMQTLADRVRAAGGRSYLIHLGTFSGGLAAAGYVPAGYELASQLRECGARAQHVIVAVGSGGTYAGLLLGLRLAGEECHVLGASVNAPAAEHSARISGHVRVAADLLGARSSVRDDEIDITDGHIGLGYGIPTSDSVEAVRLAAKTEGLLFDPIYTGKAWAALAAAVRTGAVDRGTTVVFVQTGGAPNLFVHAEAVAGVPAGRATRGT